MKNKISCELALTAAALQPRHSGVAHAQTAAPAGVTEHIATATAAAKIDELGPLGLCKTATPEQAPSFMDKLQRDAEGAAAGADAGDGRSVFPRHALEHGLGMKTSAGLIIIDALDNTDEAKQYIEGGLRKLELDPADIKYVIVSHAHGDHYGGAAYLKEKFNPRIVMSEIDWKVFEDPKFDPKRIPLFDPPPKRDMAVNDGDTITLGDTTLKLYVIPGHTLGTLATVFTVHDHGEAHRAVAWGGTAYNFGPLPRPAADLCRHHLEISRHPEAGKR